MIISASRRTDIPAFYSEWFMNRIREGYALVPNPLFPEKVSRVDLRPEAVDAIVFVTRNPGPLLPHLDELETVGHRFCFQITITGYPRILEPHVPDLDDAVRLFRELSGRIGPGKIIWRFDPVVISTLTGEDFILERFSDLAGKLRHSTRRVIISFADFYQKVIRNFRQIEQGTGASFLDLHDDPVRLHRIAAGLSEIARSHHLQIFSCAEKQDLSSAGINKGKCIDAEYLSNAFGTTLRSSKAKNQRKDCGCDHSRDIGQYDTCLHGCAYCYATKSFQAARQNLLMHNSQSPCLVGKYRAILPEENQPCLF